MSIRIKSISLVAFFTLLSRFLGFLRDILFTYILGASSTFEAFIATYQIPNFFRLLLGEGALHGAVIPVFTETKVKEGKDSADRLASSLIFIMFFIFLLIILFVWWKTPVVVSVFLPGFLNEKPKFDISILFLKIMFPFLMFIGLAALMMAFLNSGGKYAISSFAPSILNIAIIIYLLIIFPSIKKTGYGFSLLAFSVVMGGFLQFLIQYIWIRKDGFILKLVIKHHALYKILRLFIPTCLIFGTTQLNLLISRQLASFLPTGSISYLYYANRILQLPLGVFTIAIATVSLPLFSEEVAKKSKKTFEIAFQGNFILILFLLLPVSIFLYYFSPYIISIVFERGAFTTLDTIKTAQALSFYAIGLLFFSFNRIFHTMFFAKKDTKTPLKIAVFTLFLNVILNLIFLFPLGHMGLALANSISGIFQFILLFYFVYKFINAGKILFDAKDVLFKIFCINALFFLLTKLSNIFLVHNGNLMFFFGISFSLGFIYLAMAYYLKVFVYFKGLK